MFSGITKAQLAIIRTEVQQRELQRVLRVVLELPRWTLTLGDSILLNGVCSTVVEYSDTECSVDFMAQTLDLTTVKQWHVGDVINAEPPLTLQDGLSGSIVSGHVDTVGELRYSKQGHRTVVSLTFANEYAKYVVKQGGITINGVNLTITQIVENGCEVELVPYTEQHTNLIRGEAGVTRLVNLEFDYFAKMMVRYLETRP